MPKRSSKKQPEKDVNQLAASIVGQATSETPDQIKTLPDGKNPAAVALGRLGGLKGGKARAESLTARERRLIAKKGGLARWKPK